MVENVIIVIAVAIVILAGATAWWFENGPSHRGEEPTDADNGELTKSNK